MDQEKVDAAIADLHGRLEAWGWGDYPRDRSTVPYEDSMWARLQNYARTKYSTADPALKAALKKHFDEWGKDEHREFTAFDEEERQRRLRERPHSVEPGYILGELRTDGLYRCASSPASTQEAWWSYLRFYSDGTVLSVTSTGDEQQVARWFNKEHSGVERRQYSQSGGSITFSLSGTEYDGTVGVDEISFTQVRQNTGNSAEQIYSFVPISSAF